MRQAIIPPILMFAVFFSPAQAQQKDGLESLEKLSKVHQDYIARAKQIADNDAEGHFSLAQWCVDVKMYNDARIECEKVLALAPNHAGARNAMGHKRAKTGWEPDFALLSKDIVYVADPRTAKEYADNPVYRRMEAYLKNPETIESISRRIYERSGFQRFPGELDVQITLTTSVPNNAYAFTQAVGYTKGICRLKVTVLINLTKTMIACEEGPMKFLDAMALHELVHAHMMPVANKWSSWLNEGLASYIDGEEFQIRELLAGGFGDLESKPETYIQNYARGYLFWLYIDEVFGRDVMVRVLRDIVLHYREPRAAVVNATGRSWNDLKSGLLDYARKRIDRFAAVYGTIAPETPWLGLLPWWREGMEVEVAFAVPGSGAKQGGIRAGDLITHVNNAPVKGCKGLVEALASAKAGDTLVVTVKREGKPVDLKITLGNPPKFARGEWDSVRQIL